MTRAACLDPVAELRRDGSLMVRWTCVLTAELVEVEVRASDVADLDVGQPTPITARAWPMADAVAAVRAEADQLRAELRAFEEGRRRC